MDIFCIDCGATTEHKYIGANPETGQSLYQCSECDERQETDEDGA